ncbi:hypothetical protein [Azohydromonas lata]|uniref:hypothetical protein n=1 Tax=Azohydromonas lata TaxID=45677 RepID=UPI00082C2592|nr:hypothetical protein [Azohydromonas lata]
MDDVGHVLISTMPMADRVSRYLQARYFAVQLTALEEAAAGIGCLFALQAHADDLPEDAREHLAFAVALARERYLAPNSTVQACHAYASDRVADGYADALLRDMLAALEALGVRPQVQPHGIDHRAMQQRQRAWKAEAASGMDAMSLSPVQERIERPEDFPAFLEDVQKG